jgi:hypothetical protein
MIQRYTKCQWTHLKNECTCHCNFFSNNCSPYWSNWCQILFPGVREDTFHKLLVYLYTDDIPAISPARCLDLLELGNRLCLPRLVNLVERRVVEEMMRLCASDSADLVVEHCLRLLEPCKVAFRQSWSVLLWGSLLYIVCVCLDMSVKVCVDLSSSFYWIYYEVRLNSAPLFPVCRQDPEFKQWQQESNQ